MDFSSFDTMNIDEIDKLKNVFPLQSELIEYLLLKILDTSSIPIGSLAIKIALEKVNINTGSATIGRILKMMDSHGYTYKVSNKGRKLTDLGLQKIKHMNNVILEMSLGNNIVEASRARKNNVRDLIDLIIARKVIECQAIRLAAEKADEKDLKEISWALVQHRMIVERKLNPAGAGLDFHILSVKASKNKFMEAVVKLLAYEERNIEFSTLKLSTTAHAKDYLDIHQKILDAMLQKDADKAEALMKEHFDEIMNALVQDL